MRYRHPGEWIKRRLLARAKRNLLTGCLEWDGGSANPAGYAKLWDGTKAVYVHRLAYQLFVGPIPDGMDVLHHCDTPGCIEPTDLWLGTQADNNRDREIKDRGGAWRMRGRKRGPSPQRGAAHPLSKIDENTARAILAEPHAMGTDLAKRYGISASSVYSMRKGKLWAWLPRPSPLPPG